MFTFLPEGRGLRLFNFCHLAAAGLDPAGAGQGVERRPRRGPALLQAAASSVALEPDKT